MRTAKAVMRSKTQNDMDLMAKRKRRRNFDRKKALKNCGTINEDDLIDPRDYFKPQRNESRNQVKTQQLCRQVEQTLEMVINDCDPDSMVASMRVSAVIPAPDCSRMLVTLIVDIALEQFDMNQAMEDLVEQKSRLRSEVARSISRKRAPLLIYNLLPPVTSFAAKDDCETGGEDG